MALAENEPALVIGETGLLSDRPGFEVEFLRRGSIPEMSYTSHRHEILMILAGHWRLSWSGGENLLSLQEIPVLFRQGLNILLSPPWQKMPPYIGSWIQMIQLGQRWSFKEFYFFC
jgi:hypothetical protein